MKMLSKLMERPLSPYVLAICTALAYEILVIHEDIAPIAAFFMSFDIVGVDKCKLHPVADPGGGTTRPPPPKKKIRSTMFSMPILYHSDCNASK